MDPTKPLIIFCWSKKCKQKSWTESELSDLSSMVVYVYKSRICSSLICVYGPFGFINDLAQLIVGVGLGWIAKKTQGNQKWHPVY